MTHPRDPALRWQVSTLVACDGLGEFRHVWNELNNKLASSHCLLDSRFIDPLLKRFGSNNVLLAIAICGARPVAMLLLDRVPRLGIWSSFLPGQLQIGPSLLSEGLDLQGLFAVLPGHAMELDLLCNDPAFGDWRRLGSSSNKSLPHALTMSVSLKGSFDDYWAQRPRKLVQNMRRYLRRLQAEAAGERLVVIDDPQRLTAAVGRYAELEGRGWKGAQGTALRGDNAQGLFYQEVMVAFAARRQALVYELRLGDQLIASRMLLIRDGMAIMLKTTFDERFDRFAPGRVLLFRTLEDLFTRIPGGAAEFYTNADPDLLAWSTSQRWINHVSIYRHAGLPAFYSILRRARRGRGWRTSQRRVNMKTIVERSGTTTACFNHPNELPEQALALLQRSEYTYVEFGADWFGLLSDTVFKAPGHAAFHVLSRQHQVLAVLPVGRQRTGKYAEVGALANYYTTLYAPALTQGLTPEDLLPLIVALRNENPGTPAYRFGPMDPGAREFQLLRDALRLAGLHVHQYFAFGNWHLPVDFDWATYLKNRSGQLRSTIKRMSKRLAAEDNGRMEIIREEADAERGIAAYQAVYAASWKVPEPYVDFIPGLIRLCARRGWLRLGLAWIGDQPIAAQLWIVNAGRAHVYKLAYDEAYKSIAPGTLLTAMLLEEVIDRDKVTEVDYLIGDDAYKQTWMSHRRERFGLVAYDPRTLGGLVGLTRQALGAAWRRLRPKPATGTDNPSA